jgi:hypothetical protein
MKQGIFLLLFCHSIGAGAQQNLFVVYSFKGNVIVADGQRQTPVKIGTLLNEKVSLRLSKGDFVSVLCNESHLFTIDHPGAYPMNRFADSCRGEANSLTVNYMRYVWTQFTHEHESPEVDRKEYMSNVGAVSRGVNNILVNPLLNNMNYRSGTLMLNWKFYGEGAVFEIRVYNAPKAGSLLFDTTVTGTRYPVAALLSSLPAGKTYYWTVAAKGEDNQDRFSIAYVTAAEFSALMDSLRSGAGYETAAQQAFREGFMLEEANYPADALRYYKRAAVAQSDPLYSSTIAAFKKDYGQE